MEAGALHAPAALGRSRSISVSTPLLRLRSDEQLVALFRAGNEDAFGVIHDRYRQRLFSYSRQMLGGSRQDAEDALQDVFLRAYGALRSNDRPVSLRAWLYRVAHNRCIDHLRRPVPAHSDVFDMSRTPLHDPMLETERREDLRRLVADVRRLPEAQRSALLMREMEGLSYAELADALDVSVPAIKSLLVRARIGLVEAIEARDTACTDIRTDLVQSFDRGVRASGNARRHMRECSGCREYRTQLRGVQQGLGALTPSAGPFSALAKIFGIGGSAAGGGAAAGGGGAVLVGGGVTAVTACKVAALVCSAALVATGAREVEKAVNPAPTSGTTHATHHATTATPFTGPAVSSSDLKRWVRLPAPTAPLHEAAATAPLTATSPIKSATTRSAPLTPDGDVYGPTPIDPKADPGVTGGAIAPDEPTTDGTGAPTAAPAGTAGTTAPGAPPAGTLQQIVTSNGSSGSGTSSSGTSTSSTSSDSGSTTTPPSSGTASPTRS